MKDREGECQIIELSFTYSLVASFIETIANFRRMGDEDCYVLELSAFIVTSESMSVFSHEIRA